MINSSHFESNLQPVFITLETSPSLRYGFKGQTSWPVCFFSLLQKTLLL